MITPYEFPPGLTSSRGCSGYSLSREGNKNSTYQDEDGRRKSDRKTQSHRRAIRSVPRTTKTTRYSRSLGRSWPVHVLRTRRRLHGARPALRRPIRFVVARRRGRLLFQNPRRHHHRRSSSRDRAPESAATASRSCLRPPPSSPSPCPPTSPTSPSSAPFLRGSLAPSTYTHPSAPPADLSTRSILSTSNPWAFLRSRGPFGGGKRGTTRFYVQRLSRDGRRELGRGLFVSFSMCLVHQRCWFHRPILSLENLTGHNLFQQP